MSGKQKCKNENKRQPDDKTQKQSKSENLFESNLSSWRKLFVFGGAEEAATKVDYR